MGVPFGALDATDATARRLCSGTYPNHPIFDRFLRSLTVGSLPPLFLSGSSISVLKPNDPKGDTLAHTAASPPPPCVADERVQRGNASAVDIAWILRECASLDAIAAPRVAATLDGGGTADVASVETLADGTVVATVAATVADAGASDAAAVAGGGRSRIHIGRRYFSARREDFHTLAFAVENGMAAHSWPAKMLQNTLFSDRTRCVCTATALGPHSCMVLCNSLVAGTRP